MDCERCGQAPATSHVTEVARGCPKELAVWGKCADALSLLDADEGFRCSRCGTEIGEAQLLEVVRTVKAKWGRFDENAWNELLATAACPICGEGLKLPRIPWELFADPSTAIPLSLRSRRRRPPPTPGPAHPQS